MSNVTLDVDGPIARVRLTRADKLNALTLETLTGLIDAAHRVRRDRDVRAVIISGEGDSFCSGLDFASVLKKPGGIVNGFWPRPWRGTNTFQEACWAWRRIPVPVIAAVHGHCYGGGLQIALSADFRYATPDSQWSVLESRWGLIPDMSGIRTLTEILPPDQVKLLTMTAKMFSGKEAADLGLVTEVASDPMAAAEELAQDLAGRSPDAVAAAKRLINGAQTASERSVFGRERREQMLLLALGNTKRAQQAAFKRETAKFTNRFRR